MKKIAIIGHNQEALSVITKVAKHNDIEIVVSNNDTLEYLEKRVEEKDKVFTLTNPRNYDLKYEPQAFYKHKNRPTKITDLKKRKSKRKTAKKSRKNNKH